MLKPQSKKLDMQHFINHIALVIDGSKSMQHLTDNVVKVFDRELDNLKRRSVELDQETRISIYIFNSNYKCLVFDMDVMRMKSLKDYYHTSGTTALIKTTVQAIQDMKMLPEAYGDHAFLVYVITDGEENASRMSPSKLVDAIKQMSENWTIVCLVPNHTGVYEAKKFGFPVDNIQIWDTSVRGIEKAGENFTSAMDNYMSLRSQGIRSTKNFFKTDLTSVTLKDLKDLAPLTDREIRVFSIHRVVGSREYVNTSTSYDYVKGMVFYQLTKPETIQANKEIIIFNKFDNTYYGGKNARGLLGLPSREFRVHPGNHSHFDVFVQSNAVNRKLQPKTKVILKID